MRVFFIWLALCKMPIKEKRILLNNQGLLINEYENNNRNISLKDVEIYEKKLSNIGVKLLTPVDKEYLIAFSNFDDRPIILYAKGNSGLLMKKGVAIVGSRNCNKYGESVTKSCALKISSFGETIISGGARGVDRIAHETSLSKSNPTICVLGSGFNKPYPFEHRFLYERIAENGLLLSEYPVDLQARKYFFPERNRLIAMLSKIVIVTQASKKSGSLSTATYAVDMGIDLMAFPNSIFDCESEGSNQLIQMRAQMINNVNEIFTY